MSRGCDSVAATSIIGAGAATSQPPNLHELMKDVIAVQMQVVWDIGNRSRHTRATKLLCRAGDRV